MSDKRDRKEVTLPAPVWTADLTLSDSEVDSLLLSKGLNSRIIRREEGFDNWVYWLDEGLILRVARRQVAVAGIERERLLLSRIEGVLDPLRTPRIVASGSVEGIPYLIYEPVMGCPIYRVDSLTPGQASKLGAALKRLHSFRIEGFPTDSNQRSEWQVQFDRGRKVLSELGEEVRPALEWWQSLPENSAAELSVSSFVHGDLHPLHLLIDDSSDDLSGLIDWGDAGYANRSVDFMTYFSHCDSGAREAWRNAYGEITSEELLNARLLSVRVNAVLAQSAGDFPQHVGLKAASLRAIQRCVEGGLDD